MKKTGILVIIALFAALMAACGGTAENITIHKGNPFPLSFYSWVCDLGRGP